MLDIFGFDAGVWDSDDQDRAVAVEPIPSNNGGNYGDVFGVLEKAGSFIGNLATTASSFVTARNAQSLDRQKQQLEIDQAKLLGDLQRQKITGAIDVEKYRTAAEIARAQQQINGMPSLGQLLYGGSSGGGGVGFNPLGLVVLGAIGYFGYKALKAT